MLVRCDDFIRLLDLAVKLGSIEALYLILCSTIEVNFDGRSASLIGQLLLVTLPGQIRLDEIRPL